MNSEMAYSMYKVIFYDLEVIPSSLCGVERLEKSESGTGIRKKKGR